MFKKKKNEGEKAVIRLKYNKEVLGNDWAFHEREFNISDLFELLQIGNGAFVAHPWNGRILTLLYFLTCFIFFIWLCSRDDK